MVFVKSAPVLVFAALLSGCSGFGAISLPGFGGAEAEASNQPAPGNAAPAGVVETTELPPLVGQSEGADPFLNPDTQVAAASPWPPTDPAMTAATPDAPGELALTQTPPAAGGPSAGGAAGEIARPDLLGAWTLTDGTESCELFMTLTTWTGGYRASTRGCTSTTLASISAWDLNGQQVVLAGPEGVTVARLYSSGMNRFDGQTETEAATVSFFR